MFFTSIFAFMKNIQGNLQRAYSVDYNILSYHCDSFTDLRVSALCTFMQESAWLHSDHMGIGWKILMNESNCFWALTRLKIRILKIPRWGDTITVTTWSRGTDSIQFFRDWRIFDAKGVLCAVGSSVWIIMDTEHRQVQRNSSLALRFPLQGEQVFLEKLRKIPSLHAPVFSHPAPIRYSELDMNMHMNNVSYLIRFLDSETFLFRNENRIREAELNFLHEATGEVPISVGKADRDGARYYTLVSELQKTELCRGKIIWEPRDEIPRSPMSSSR